MATWSRDKVLNFIEEYRSQECLWKVKSKDYSNRIKREQAYQQLVDFVQSFEPGADKDFVVKKINNLRNSFRKQLRKLDDLKVSGSGADEIACEPKLWYFGALEFLRDQDTSRPSQTNLDPEFAEEPTFTPLDVEADVLGSSGSPTGPLTPNSSGSRSTTPLPAHKAAQGAGNSGGSSSSSSRPTKRKAPIENELLTLARNRLLNSPNVREEDQFDSFAKTIGHKLRNMPRDQSVHAQKLIWEVLYEGELGTLSKSAAIMDRTSV